MHGYSHICPRVRAHRAQLWFTLELGIYFCITNAALGCTPLHWAAIRGNLEACTVLVQAGKKEDLMVKDKTGFTPVQLAANNGHRQVAFFLVSNMRFLFFRRLELFVCSA